MIHSLTTESVSDMQNKVSMTPHIVRIDYSTTSSDTWMNVDDQTDALTIWKWSPAVNNGQIIAPTPTDVHPLIIGRFLDNSQYSGRYEAKASEETASTHPGLVLDYLGQMSAFTSFLGATQNICPDFTTTPFTDVFTVHLPNPAMKLVQFAKNQVGDVVEKPLSQIVTWSNNINANCPVIDNSVAPVWKVKDIPNDWADPPQTATLENFVALDSTSAPTKIMVWTGDPSMKEHWRKIAEPESRMALVKATFKFKNSHWGTNSFIFYVQLGSIQPEVRDIYFDTQWTPQGQSALYWKSILTTRLWPFFVKDDGTLNDDPETCTP